MLLRYFSLSLALVMVLFTSVGCATSTAHQAGLKRKPTVLATKKRVRTTAYTAQEPGSAGASGHRLKSGLVTSAASDWSLFPLGTKFRLVQTGELFEIDDYGSALVGKNTIDLYKTSSRAMRNWGARTVDIEVLEWGSPEKSLEILAPRTRSRHVREMVSNLRGQVHAE